MSRRAEQWIAAQEIALLEAIYQLDSRSEPEEPHQPIRLKVQSVRVVKSRLRRDSSQPNRPITG